MRAAFGARWFSIRSAPRLAVARLGMEHRVAYVERCTFFSIAISIVFSLWAGAVARERNRSMLPYMVLGALFPLRTWRRLVMRPRGALDREVLRAW